MNLVEKFYSNDKEVPSLSFRLGQTIYNSLELEMRGVRYMDESLQQQLINLRDTLLNWCINDLLSEKVNQLKTFEPNNILSNLNYASVPLILYLDIITNLFNFIQSVETIKPKENYLVTLLCIKSISDFITNYKICKFEVVEQNKYKTVLIAGDMFIKILIDRKNMTILYGNGGEFIAIRGLNSVGKKKLIKANLKFTDILIR